MNSSMPAGPSSRWSVRPQLGALVASAIPALLALAAVAPALGAALIDPFQVRSIREMLSDVLPEPEDLGAEAQFVLDNLTRLLRRTTPNDRVDVPVAVLLSKFDAMQELRHIDDTFWRSIFDLPGSAFQRDPSLDPGFDTDDSDLLQAEVRSLLHLLHADDLLIQLESGYRNSRLFVTSALGNAPRAGALHANGIAPFRVLDTVKWILRETRLLDRS